MNTQAIDSIREHMEVVCSRDMHVGTVDHVEGGRIKLTKDDSPDGRHHFIPLALVADVDDKVHLSRHSAEVMQMWDWE